jgi:hypothetical protein
MHTAPVPAIIVFEARCGAHATLCALGELDLHEAVDALQAVAIANGLIAEIGQDSIQQVMATGFREGFAMNAPEVDAWPDEDHDEWEREGWTRAAQNYREQRGSRHFLVEYTPQELARLRALLADGVTLDRAYAEIHARHFAGHAAESTVEALMLGLRERGTAALAEEPARQRLAQLDEEQVIQVGDRLQALRPHIAKVWAPAEVQQLLETWGGLRGA